MVLNCVIRTDRRSRLSRSSRNTSRRRASPTELSPHTTHNGARLKRHLKRKNSSGRTSALTSIRSRVRSIFALTRITHTPTRENRQRRPLYRHFPSSHKRTWILPICDGQTSCSLDASAACTSSRVRHSFKEEVPAHWSARWRPIWENDPALG